MTRMDKLVVIGSPGSGKRAFSASLSQITHLPVTNLDNLYWSHEGKYVGDDIFYPRVEQVMESGKWIISGTYLNVLDMLLDASDGAFFLDYSLETCLESVRNYKATRPDTNWSVAPEGNENEAAYINKFHMEVRPKVMEALRTRPHLLVNRFTHQTGATTYLKAMGWSGKY
ncbi:transcriptional regulator [Corynebacterium pyruviciproducens]|uniref:transcriptional regulator n=1 Tax=Corynebacterium pyruviciproducens TaxID=598660 RepID=UPI0023F22705|nr:transcriptional regulator [Corynebacterium pyruviciproducens]MDH4657981.1 transcriptional regulator [Corynebacterium pyruviciproducens]